MGKRGAPAAGRVIVGVMSGTSLDGITAAVVRFTDATRDARSDGDAMGSELEAELLGFLTREYAPSQRARLAAATEGGTAQAYCRLAFDLGGWLADAAAAALADAGVARADVTAIASHGHTVWHEPGHSTWQLGETSVIAERLGCPVIGDFRVADVAAGGHGAPLVAIADALLFADHAHWRALQNLGGIANVTIVPPARATDRWRAVRAFDTGPGVMVIDAVTQLLVPGLAYDVDGARAAGGHAVVEVVDASLRHPYFAAEPPKTTGREQFGRAFAERLVADCRAARPGISAEDVIATAVALTARSIAAAYDRFVPEPVADVVVSGGGAKNTAIMRALQAALGRRPVSRFEERFFDGEAKEAVAFALLGLLHMQRRPGNLPTVTGARGVRVLGKQTLPPAGVDPTPADAARPASARTRKRPPVLPARGTTASQETRQYDRGQRREHGHDERDQQRPVRPRGSTRRGR